MNSVSLEHTLCINTGRVPYMIRNGHSSKVMICIIGLENTFFNNNNCVCASHSDYWSGKLKTDDCHMLVLIAY